MQKLWCVFQKEERKMKTGVSGVLLIKSFEALKLNAYLCPARVWTIGYGHTKTAKAGMRITPEWALDLLRDDLQDAENAVNQSVKVKLTQNQFDALVSFVFNVGGGAFRKSTLLKLLNKGQYDAVPAQLMRWNRAGGKALPGLTRRRVEEAALWSRRNDIADMPQKVDKPKFFNK